MTCMHTKTIDEQNVIIYICNSLFQTPNELNPITRHHLSTSHPVVNDCSSSSYVIVGACPNNSYWKCQPHRQHKDQNVLKLPVVTRPVPPLLLCLSSCSMPLKLMEQHLAPGVCCSEGFAAADCRSSSHHCQCQCHRQLFLLFPFEAANACLMAPPAYCPH